MPTVENPKFSNGTEDDKRIKKLNQTREQRDVHGSTHVYGVAQFVTKMLNTLQCNPELTLKDKIITIVCAFMHDSCRKGEGVDFWDNDSAILATRVLKIFGLNSEEDKQYLMEIMEYVGDKDAKIDVNIIVEYGARIPEVAFEIQSRVKKAVENMTGLKVLEVNVHVQGVHAITEKEVKQEDTEKTENTENVENNEENVQE